MKKINNNIQFLLFLAFIPSCTRSIDMDTGEKPTVVVECTLTNEQPQTLSLSFTKGASRKEAQHLSAATATLIDETESRTVGTFIGNGSGEWSLDYAAVPLHSYRLEVEVDGYDKIYAEQTMPDKMAVHAQYSFAVADDEAFQHYSPLIGTVYYIKSLPNFVWAYGLNYNSSTGKREIAEEICTDFKDVDNFNLDGNVYAPVGKDTVDAANLPCFCEQYPPLRGYGMHRRFLRLPKRTDNSNSFFIISGSFKGNYLHGDGSVLYREPLPDQGYVEFMSVSDDYDQYLRDAIYYQQLKESTDLSSVYIRDNIHTNIVGGIGFFGAVAKQKMTWEEGYTVLYYY